MGMRDNQLRLTLLGKPQFEYKGQPLSGLTALKGQALLAYLAVTRQPHSRSALAGLLWSEMPEADARANLRVTLSQLRKAVNDYLIVTRRSIEFNRNSNYWLDVEVLEKTARSGLSPAVELYRGDFLEDFYAPEAVAFEEWLRVERERLRQLALEGLGRLAGAALEGGQVAEGINAARRLLSLEPWLETGHQQLMKLLAASGQRSAALAQYETCRRLLAEGLGVEPAPETRTLYEQIRQGRQNSDLNAPLQPAPDASAAQSHPSRHNLPYPATSFVGRQKELDNLLNCLSLPDCRLLSLVGPGGMGKTRLALQTAKTLVKQEQRLFAEGVYLVPLAGIMSSEALVPAMANAVGFSFSGSQEPYRQLLSYLQPKSLLLLLDNFEHLVPEASLLTDLLQAIPELKFLVTSRTCLNLYEEWQIELHGLEAPPANMQLEQLKSYSAVQLFIERARQVNLDFPSEGDLPVVGRICQMLEGMPLAIELAARWTQSYSSWEILGQIQQGLDFLATPVQNIPERQRSLRVTFEHSWQLLLAEEQRVFASLAVFQGGFEAEAAKYVANASLLALARLGDSSMLDSREGRHHIHELLRQFALGKLTEAVRRLAHWRHCAFYATFLQRREPSRQTAQEPAALAEINTELDNIRAGWAWLIKHLADPDQVETVIEHFQQYLPMLAYFYERQNRFQEGGRVFQQAATAMEAAGWLESAPSEPVGLKKRLVLALIWSCQARLYFNLSQFIEVERLVERSLPLLHQADQRQEIAIALACLGRAYDRMGSYTQAKQRLQESLDFFRKIGDRIGSTVALHGLGALANSEGRYQEAQRFFEECLTIFKETGYQRGIATMLNNLGTSYVRRGKPEQAKPFYEKAFEAAEVAGETLVIAAILSNLGSISRLMSEYETSVRYYEESLAMFRKLQEQRWTAATLNGLGLVLVEMADLAAAKRCLQEGLAISRSIQSVPDALDSLAALGELLAKEGHQEKAVELVSFVANHPVTKTMARQRSEQILLQLKGQLPIGIWQIANERGSSQTLEAIVVGIAS